MKLLIDECLHTSLVALAQNYGHEAAHVAWLGLAGEADRDLMKRVVAGDFTFVTKNARDFRRLFAREPLHAGLIIIVPRSCRRGSESCSGPSSTRCRTARSQ